MAAIEQIFQRVHPALARRGGGPTPRAGNSISGSQDEQGEFHTVTLDGHGRSVLGVLNQVVKQSGRGWLVVTDRENGRVRSLGLIHRHGAITRVDLD